MGRGPAVVREQQRKKRGAEKKRRTRSWPRLSTRPAAVGCRARSTYSADVPHPVTVRSQRVACVWARARYDRGLVHLSVQWGLSLEGAGGGGMWRAVQALLQTHTRDRVLLRARTSTTGKDGHTRTRVDTARGGCLLSSGKKRWTGRRRLRNASTPGKQQPVALTTTPAVAGVVTAVRHGAIWQGQVTPTTGDTTVANAGGHREHDRRKEKRAGI